MNVESKMFWYLTPFFLMMAIIYGLWTDWSEWVGITGMFLTGGMTAMIAWFLGMTGKSLPGQRPEDDRDGEISQVAGHFGHFAPYSWWPLFLAASAAVVFLGVAIGWWMVIIGVMFLLFSIVGWVYEYFSGPQAI